MLSCISYEAEKDDDEHIHTIYDKSMNSVIMYFFCMVKFILILICSGRIISTYIACMHYAYYEHFNLAVFHSFMEDCLIMYTIYFYNTVYLIYRFYMTNQMLIWPILKYCTILETWNCFILYSFWYISTLLWRARVSDKSLCVYVLYRQDMICFHYEKAELAWFETVCSFCSL